jgi:hypothetical protein
MLNRYLGPSDYHGPNNLHRSLSIGRHSVSTAPSFGLATKISRRGSISKPFLICNGTRYGSDRLCNNDELTGASFVESGFAANLRDVDEFTSSIVNWIRRDVFENGTCILVGTKIQLRLSAPYISLTNTIDTTIIFNILQAYCSDDVAEFNAGLKKWIVPTEPWEFPLC